MDLGALRRCESLVWLATRRDPRLASHPNPAAKCPSYFLADPYERKHYPLDLPDPAEAIKFVMEQRGLSVKDREPIIGRSNRVYEILFRKRSLTLKMIWRLHKGLGIPAESLIKQPGQEHAA